MKLRILRGRDHPGLSRWVLNLMTNVLIRDTRGRFDRRGGDTVTTEAGMDRCSHESGVLTAPRSWRRQRSFAPGMANTLILDFRPPELCKNKFLFFLSHEFVAICYSSQKSNIFTDYLLHAKSDLDWVI